LTVAENIRFYGGVYGLDRKTLADESERLITRLGLTAQAKTKVAGLPLGVKQKLSFSTALIHSPKIVFLDEPTGGVDPITRRQFWEMIYQAAADGTTIFITTHYMDEAEYCSRVSIMVDGVIKALDTPRGMKNTYNCDSMDEVFLKLARDAVRGE
jgi:ABC-2 type transport system ATP-binding protein